MRLYLTDKSLRIQIFWLTLKIGTFDRSVISSQVEVKGRRDEFLRTCKIKIFYCAITFDWQKWMIDVANNRGLPPPFTSIDSTCTPAFSCEKWHPQFCNLSIAVCWVGVQTLVLEMRGDVFSFKEYFVERIRVKCDAKRDRTSDQ